MSGRGRNFRRGGNRGRSSSRGGFQQQQLPAGVKLPTNYASAEEVDKVVQERKKLEARLEQNEQLAKAAENKPKNPKIDKIIEEGKEIVSKFFKGYSPTERGNVKVELDSTFVHRVCEPYYEKIDQVVRDMNSDLADETKLEEEQQNVCNKFVGAVDISTAVKLYKSATTEQQDRLFYYNALHKPTMTLPKKLSVIINQLGKTDLRDDNKIRIVGQDLVAKRHLVRGLMRYYGRRKVTGYMKTGADYDELRKITSVRKFNGMIDASSSSVVYIQERIQRIFDEMRIKEYEVVDTSGKKCKISLPPFDFENATPATFKEYATNNMYDIFTFKNNNDIARFAALSALSLMNLSWLKDPSKKIGDLLGTEKTQTALDDFSVEMALDMAGFWSINTYFDVMDLNELAIEAISDWNGSLAPRLKGYMKLDSISFSEYGSDSQVVEVDRNRISDTSNKWKQVYQYQHGIRLNIMVGKCKSWVKQKISESGAIFGSIVGFNTNVEYVSNFDIQLEGNNRNILREFVRSDFL